jgi:(2Fe-2S) ferredoxin
MRLKMKAQPLPGSNSRPAAVFCSPDDRRACVTVCAPTDGCICSCHEVRQALEDEVRSRNLGIQVGSMKVGCDGKCPFGPLVGFPQRGFYYHRLTADRAWEVVAETLEKGHILFDLLHVDVLHSTSGQFIYDHASGFIAAIDSDHCMVQAAKYFLDFDKGMSCGKCTPCRAGFVYLREIIEAITRGEGLPEDIRTMTSILSAMRQAAYCEYAGYGSGPVAAMLKHFRSEFLLHIDQKICPSGGCQNLPTQKQA